MAHILLIEPDVVLAANYQQALEHAGQSVSVVHGAQAAIMAADQQLPDVIVLELQLSNHSGVEFLYEFRSYPEWQNIPVVVQTFIPEREFASSKSLLKNELGVVAYLYKPRTSLQKLVQTVSALTTVTA